MAISSLSFSRGVRFMAASPSLLFLRTCAPASLPDARQSATAQMGESGGGGLAQGVGRRAGEAGDEQAVQAETPEAQLCVSGGFAGPPGGFRRRARPSARVATARAPAPQAGRSSATDISSPMRISSAKINRPSRRMRQLSRKNPATAVSPMAWRPNTRLSTRRRRKLAARSTERRRASRARSNRMVSCGIQSSLRAGAEAQLDVHLRRGAIAAVDFLGRLGGERGLGACASSDVISRADRRRRRRRRY